MRRIWIFGNWKAAFLLCLAGSIVSPAQTFRTLVDLNGANGAAPSGPLLQGLDGNLRGTASSGGTGDVGTVFELTSAGVLTTLYNFCTKNGCKDGANPTAELVQARDGAFYGITTGGGTNSRGTVFGLTPAGKLRTVYSFCVQADCADGEFPGGLLLAPNGNFYGTTQAGGANGQGTVFSLTFDSDLATLYSFCAQASCTDGEVPNGLVLASDGNFYGTTQGGGANGYGTVFKITPSGALTTLYSFCAQTNCTDGAEPGAALLQANDGNLYGTTDSGGSIGGDGTIFKITLEGALTTLHTFCAQGTCDDGSAPISPLVQATDRAFYGTTGNAGANNYGTIFRITSEGDLTTLHSFNGSDGGDVKTGLFQATNGNLYGTAADGGSGSCDTCGTIFSLNVGLGQFAETLPTSGAVGNTIDILSQGLTGTTGVSLNGTTANFTVVSDTDLTVTIPTGATTGFVTLTLPTATLKSNQEFRVTP
jgi:uncharacterized repeat protein (TIGR03803 family)